MADDNQKNPLAPTTLFKRSDEESPAPAGPWDRHNKWQSRREHQSSKCFVYILVWIVVQAALALILALVIFRIDTPKLSVDSVIVENLDYSSAPSLNATLIAQVAVKNNNFGRFKFKNGTSVVLLYRGEPIAEKVPILGSSAKGRDTWRVNVTLEVSSATLLTQSSHNTTGNLTDDINSRMVELRSYARLGGRVEVLGILRRRKTPEMNCTMTLHLSTQKVQELRCR